MIDGTTVNQYVLYKYEQVSPSDSYNEAERYLFVPPFTSSATGLYYRHESVDEFSKHFARLSELKGRFPIDKEGAVERPTDDAIDTAKIVLESFKNYSIVPTRVIASSEGGVAICVVRNSRYSDIECLNSGTILAVNADKRNAPDIWQVERDAVSLGVSLARIREFIETA